MALRATTTDENGYFQSSGRFDGSRGAIRLSGTIEWQRFRLSSQLDLDAPEGAWLPPNASGLSERELASGASPVGPQVLAQKTAEGRTSDSVRGLGRPHSR